MKPIRFSLVLLSIFLVTTGCMNTHLIAKYDTASIQSSQATRVTLLWGILQPKDIPAACESETICKITIQTNIGFIAISAITLGIVVPQKVTWDCCPSKERQDILH